jgi:hypothetical protein
MRSDPAIGTCPRMSWVRRQAQAALAPWQRRQGQTRYARSGRETLVLAPCGEDTEGSDADERSPTSQAGMRPGVGCSLWREGPYASDSRLPQTSSHASSPGRHWAEVYGHPSAAEITSTAYRNYRASLARGKGAR